MTARWLRCDGVPPAIKPGFSALRESLELSKTFSDVVQAEADHAAVHHAWPNSDATDIDFVTIDPPGATDLDQAVHLSRTEHGYLVHYAIADLTLFVTPGGALDAEVQARGQTLYAPHTRLPLHPPTLSEGAASLLPGQDRPAALWTIELDARGEMVAAQVRRARVRSRQQLTYQQVQDALDAGKAPESWQLLREIGLLRETLEAERGGVSLRVPEQEIVAQGEVWKLTFRATLPVERWNAQISLLTGMAAAQIMLKAGVGIVRTLPAAEAAGIERLRRIAGGLGIEWPPTVNYPDFVRGLDPNRSRHLAMLNACTRLFRTAGYTSFDGEPPDQTWHGALATSYAHCTAPLRRLVDRYVTQICLSVCANEAVPDWVREALPRLPGIMAETSSKARKFDRGVLNLVEALVLQHRLGEHFAATVIEVDSKRPRGDVQLRKPAVDAPYVGEAELGADVDVVLIEADVTTGRVLFQVES